MATYSKEFFTGCATDQGGTGIALPIDSGAFVTIHTTPVTTTTLDEIWMYAVNSHSAILSSGPQIRCPDRIRPRITWESRPHGR